MEARGRARLLTAVAVALALAAGAPALPAGAQAPQPACDALGAPTRLAQDDAFTGADAPDARADAVALPAPPPTPEGTLEVYFWGWLDPPAGRPGVDHSDWYLAPLQGEGERVMVEMASNYTDADAMGLYVDFLLELYAPGADEPVATLSSSTGERLDFLNHVPGAWRLHVTPLALVANAGPGACAGGAAAPPAGAPHEAQRNHGVYFGCDPFCFASPEVRA